MPGQAEVVEAREAHGVGTADSRDAALDRLIGPQERIDEPRLPQPREAILEGGTLGKRFGSRGVLVGRVLLNDWRRRCRNSPITGVKHAGGHALNQVTARDDALEPLGMKPHAVTAFEAMNGVEKPRGIDPAGVER